MIRILDLIAAQLKKMVKVETKVGEFHPSGRHVVSPHGYPSSRHFGIKSRILNLNPRRADGLPHSQRNSSEESSPAQSPKLSEKKEVLTQAPVKLIKQSVKLEEIRSTWTGRRRRVPRLGVSALSSKPKMGAENFSNKKLFHISSKEKQYKSN
ncbi:Oidioi.mRNA.OKI2018_I69.chr1.g1169.t2.cds [Oikopleura dioica]|uniref:Oidioi.mRNA.OKI2018_I69.chr1.g1169.t2.cds n=1 Tax=Oikopleura dioica TaxID=34765 RepID=A0ABN7SQW1_OIKDI|nr:Oidioi.mRNA.OKI2018_I69.chr1.g1169.t2.cds [Oikopleura dioica]